MDTKTIEVEGKTIDEAIQKACEQLDLPREKLNIEIITEGSSGFFGGFIGAKKARIRANIMFIDLSIDEPLREKKPPRPKVSAVPRAKRQEARQEVKERHDDDLLAGKAKETLGGILKRMGLDYPIRIEESPEAVTLNIEGDGSGLLIGKGGQTLDALQYIINKTSSKNGKHKKRIILDTEDYRKRREKTLIALAEKLGQKVKKTRRPITVNPMNAHDRRIIHLALQDDRQLTTKSRGEGNYRKIVILPTKKD